MNQQNIPTMSHDVLQDLFRRMKLSYSRFFDPIDKKLRLFQMASPEHDVMGLFQQTSGVIANCIWAGQKFSVSVKDDQRVNDLIKEHILGRCELVNKFRTHSPMHINLGNMTSFVCRDIYGKQVLKFVNAILSIPIQFNDTDPTGMCYISYEYIEEQCYALVVIESMFYRKFYLFEVNPSGGLGTAVYFGSPIWSQLVGDIADTVLFEGDEFGLNKFYWYGSPNQHPRWNGTPYCLGWLTNYNGYTQLLNDYSDAKRELRLKKARLYVNRSIMGAGFSSKFNVGSPRNFSSPRSKYFGSTTPDDLSGVWPDSNAFISVENNVSDWNNPNHYTKQNIDDELYGLVDMEDENFKDYSPAIRPDFWNNLEFELGRLGKSCKLGPNFFRINSEGDITATGQIMGERDFMNTISAWEHIYAAGIKHMVRAFCWYWVQDGLISWEQLPTLDQIEVKFDHRVLTDQDKDRTFWQNALTAGAISTSCFLEHTTEMTYDEIQIDTIARLQDPLFALQFKQQKAQGDKVGEQMYGANGSSFPAQLKNNSDRTSDNKGPAKQSK